MTEDQIIAAANAAGLEQVTVRRIYDPSLNTEYLAIDAGYWSDQIGIRLEWPASDEKISDAIKKLLEHRGQHPIKSPPPKDDE